jgi:hypothetical protein
MYPTAIYNTDAEPTKITGKFDEKTATDYLKFLETGKPIPKV